jgi:hypothetical protein
LCKILEPLTPTARRIDCVAEDALDDGAFLFQETSPHPVVPRRLTFGVVLFGNQFTRVA